MKLFILYFLQDPIISPFCLSCFNPPPFRSFVFISPVRPALHKKRSTGCLIYEHRSLVLKGCVIILCNLIFRNSIPQHILECGMHINKEKSPMSQPKGKLLDRQSSYLTGRPPELVYQESSPSEYK